MGDLRRGVCSDNFEDNLVKAPRRDHMRFRTRAYIKMMRRLLMAAAEVMMTMMMMMMMTMMMIMIAVTMSPTAAIADIRTCERYSLYLTYLFHRISTTSIHDAHSRTLPSQLLPGMRRLQKLRKRQDVRDGCSLAQELAGLYRARCREHTCNASTLKAAVAATSWHTAHHILYKTLRKAQARAHRSAPATWPGNCSGCLGWQQRKVRSRKA